MVTPRCHVVFRSLLGQLKKLVLIYERSAYRTVGFSPSVMRLYHGFQDSKHVVIYVGLKKEELSARVRNHTARSLGCHRLSRL